MGETAVDTLEQQAWLDTAAEPLTGAVRGAFDRMGEGGRALRNFLHGTWLGHPLHPVFTDLPIGAWTTAAVLDATETCTRDRAYGRAADVAIGVGLAGAVGAALTGLTDWSETDGEAKRLGLVHGLLNIAATALCASSLAMRRNGTRDTGRAVGLLGLAVAYGSSYFGGALVYRDRIGVNHAVDTTLDKAAPALPSDDLGEGEKTCVDVEGAAIMLARQHGKVCALAEHCSHLGGPLSEGTLKDGSIVCPWHASEFGLGDGHVINGPATHAQPHFDVRETDGSIRVAPPAR